jgi:hypothetical protein
MEFRRRSLWNRVWDGEGLDAMGHEEYVRRIYEGDNGSRGEGAWREIGYGLVLSAWKGIRWAWEGLGLDHLWGQEQGLQEECEEPV